MITERMSYHDRIVTDPGILAGKPTVRGTRIPVDLVVGYLARNPNFDELFADYPRLTMADVQACLAYAEEVLTKDREKRPLGGTTPPATV